MPSTLRDLTELTAVAADDQLLVSDTSDAVNRDKRISRLNLVGATISGGGTIALGGFTLTVGASGLVLLKAGTPPIGNMASFAGLNSVGDAGFAAGDVARLSVPQSYPALNTFNAGISFGEDTLRYYDEGTWTPGLAIGAGGGAGISYSTQSGNYTRIGRLCFFNIDLRLTNKGVSTGAVSLTGLPIASVSNTNITWMRWTAFATAISALMLQSTGGSNMTMHYIPAAGSTTGATALNETFLSNTSTFLATGYYLV